jgi:site-specific DNA-adenine methylase
MTSIPYMGSKLKLAQQIVGYMIQHNPAADTYYDLFGGGGAITFELLRRGKRVVFANLKVAYAIITLL